MTVALVAGAALAGSCTSGRSQPPSPGPSDVATSATPSAAGPSPATTEQTVRLWLAHWVRAFIPLGQGVVQFRQAERDGDPPRMAAFARPLEGTARQVAAAIRVSPTTPPFLAPRIRRALRLLSRTEQDVREFTRVCRRRPGLPCRAAGRRLYDLRDPLLAVFAAIFRSGGIPIPTPS
jgi:hypothetical protein